MDSAHLEMEAECFTCSRDLPIGQPTGRSGLSSQLGEYHQEHIRDDTYFPAPVTGHVDHLSPVRWDISYGSVCSSTEPEQVLDCLCIRHGSGSLSVEYDSGPLHNCNTSPFPVHCNPKDIPESDRIVCLSSLCAVSHPDCASCRIPPSDLPEAKSSLQCMDDEEALSPDEGVPFHSIQTRPASDDDHTIRPDEETLILQHTATDQVTLRPRSTIPRATLTHGRLCSFACGGVPSDRIPADASGIVPTDHPPYSTNRPL